MSQTNLTNQQQPQFYLQSGILLFFVLFAGRFVIKDALSYFGCDKEIFGSYRDYKWSLIGPISCGVLALALKPFKFGKHSATNTCQ